jgi:hypothetical protein
VTDQQETESPPEQKPDLKRLRPDDGEQHLLVPKLAKKELPTLTRFFDITEKILDNDLS